jgi:1,2-dihydroxy-3-keto-5-methylthiopentene dioxygenase
MTALTIYADTSPFAEMARLAARDAIIARLVPTGVELEAWAADGDLSDVADDAAVLAAYAPAIDRLKAAGSYQSCDVVRMNPDHPQAEALRAKFLDEHVHDDDEVRFFVEGSGLFYIRHGGEVLALECTAGDLIRLPAGTTHWFDAGPRPSFTAIRLFITPDGWVARYTGDPIASQIPHYEGTA